MSPMAPVRQAPFLANPHQRTAVWSVSYSWDGLLVPAVAAAHNIDRDLLMNAIASPRQIRRPHEELCQFAASLFTAAGLEAEKAACVARLLLLTDMMGRRTHGLAQCAPYLEQLSQRRNDQGGRTHHGKGYRADYRLGRKLPARDSGSWIRRSRLCFERLPQHGVVTFAMRRSHHIGCLAALAKQATDRGYFAMIASSGPHTKAVAPFGGKAGPVQPQPIRHRLPTTAAPVLVDICASITTVSMTREKTAAGELFEHPWLLDSAGQPTRDPTVMEQASDRGSLMLLGGSKSGHKGFGLALMVEALTQGLSGFGRKDAPTRWGASVYLQLIDPEAFAGREAFCEQTGFFADQCLANAPIDPARPVRLPGEQAARTIEQCRAEGVPVSLETAAALRDWAGRLGVDAAVLS